MKQFFQNRVVAIAITAALVLGSLAYGWTQRPADVPSPGAGDWVYDGAGILSSNTEFLAESLNRGWDKSYGSVMAVATVNSTRGWDIDDYGTELAGNWGLGINNSLLLIDKGGGDYWMSPGAQVEAEVGGDTLQAQFQESFEPAFYEGSYDTAVQNAYTVMGSAMEQTYAGGSGAYSGQSYQGLESTSESGGGVSVVGIIIIAVILFLIFSAIDKSRYRHWANSSRGGMGVAPFIPLLFWHRPGGSWFRGMEDRYSSRGPSPNPGNPRSGGGYRPSGNVYRPGSTSYRSSSYRGGSGTRSGFSGSGSSYRGGSSSFRSSGGSSFRGGSGGSRGGFSGSRGGGGSRGGFGGR